MPPKKQGEKISTFNLRLSDNLKSECELLAKKENLSLNEWIKRTLSSVCGDSSDENYMEIMREVDEYVKNPNITNIHSRVEFLRKACVSLLYAESCPLCGHINLCGSNYCSECGELIRWVGPLDNYADAYYAYYQSEHPLPEGWKYMLLCPSKEEPDSGYFILKEALPRSKSQLPILVKKLTDEDIEFGREIYEDIILSHSS